MYPCILKLFGICWGTQKSSGQEPIFFKVLQKGEFSQHWECGTEMAKSKGLRQAERLLVSVTKLCCCLTPDKQSELHPFHPLHCTEPRDFLHSHVTARLLWPCYSSYVSLLIHLMFSLLTKIKLYFQHAQQSLILGRTSQAQWTSILQSNTQCIAKTILNLV